MRPDKRTFIECINHWITYLSFGLIGIGLFLFNIVYEDYDISSGILGLTPNAAHFCEHWAMTQSQDQRGYISDIQRYQNSVPNRDLIYLQKLKPITRRVGILKNSRVRNKRKILLNLSHWGGNVGSRFPRSYMIEKQEIQKIIYNFITWLTSL